MMALSGVRTSWLIRASMSALALAARSASRRACGSSLSFFLACERSRNTAKKFGPSGRVRPIVIDSGMMPPLAHAAQHVAAVVEQAGDAGALDARQIIEHRALALRREQVGEIALHEIGAVIAEQRFGAAIAGIDVALGVEHHDAFGGGVEDGAEFLGIGVTDG